MKYWPLTAVLLAFWLGRETGAEGDSLKVGEFDELRARVIRCETITLREPKSDSVTDHEHSMSMTLDRSGFSVRDANGNRRALLGHGATGSVLAFMGPDGKQRIAVLDKEGKDAVTGLIAFSKDRKSATLVTGAGVKTD